MKQFKLILDRIIHTIPFIYLKDNISYIQIKKEATNKYLVKVASSRQLGEA